MALLVGNWHDRVRDPELGKHVTSYWFVTSTQRFFDDAVDWVGPLQLGERHWLAGPATTACSAMH